MIYFKSAGIGVLIALGVLAVSLLIPSIYIRVITQVCAIGVAAYSVANSGREK